MLVSTVEVSSNVEHNEQTFLQRDTDRFDPLLSVFRTIETSVPVIEDNEQQCENTCCKTYR